MCGSMHFSKNGSILNSFLFQIEIYYLLGDLHGKESMFLVALARNEAFHFYLSTYNEAYSEILLDNSEFDLINILIEIKQIRLRRPRYFHIYITQF